MWDYDIARSNDLIGEVTFELPHLDSLVGYKGADGRSTDRVQLPSKVLMRPEHTQAGSGKDVGGSRGTLDGHFSFSLVDRGDAAAMDRLAQLARQRKLSMANEPRAGGRQLDHVSFSLRGKGLAAMDTNLFSKSSSDPFYKLHARRADGGFTEVR